MTVVVAYSNVTAMVIIIIVHNGAVVIVVVGYSSCGGDFGGSIKHEGSFI